MRIVFCGSLKPLGLPESDGFRIFLFAGKGQIVIPLTCHSSSDIRKDLGADALALPVAVHHEPADEGIVLFGIAGDEIQHGNEAIAIIEAHEELFVFLCPCSAHEWVFP